jgi:hypothetical protein
LSQSGETKHRFRRIGCARRAAGDDRQKIIILLRQTVQADETPELQLGHKKRAVTSKRQDV